MNDGEDAQRKIIYNRREVPVFYQGKIFSVAKVPVNDSFYDVVIHSGAVGIVAAIGNDKILMIKQQRPLISEDLMLEIPAGLIDKNESPHNAALRELEEECGYAAAVVSPVASYYSSPGFTNEHIHGFIATGLRKTRTNFDKDEEIETIEMPFEEVIDLLRAGKIVSGCALPILLQTAMFHREKIRNAPAIH